ncbi:hypothetical protein BDN67DRAFT_984638 [Paxillus ammoniavirescens]|nr:hypothetical protein BDN67DRAFT_984638 [Paxillus ammoniavirescens]
MHCALEYRDCGRPSQAININFSPPSRPVPFRAPLDFALVALLDLAIEPVASGSNSAAHTAQSPVSSAKEPDNTWALYLKVRLMSIKLCQLKERLDDVMERHNHLQDTMGLIKLLERLYEE